MAQDWALVQAILDYRNAKAAVEMMADQKGREELAKHPDLGNLLVEMHRAQGGAQTVEDIVRERLVDGE